MKFIRSIMLGSVLFAANVFADQSLPYLAQRVTQEIGNELTRCQLQLVDPHTVGLPYRRLDASYAVVTPTGIPLAYFIQSYGINANWRWVNPDGSYPHSIQFSNAAIRFVTPFMGNVASATRFVTSQGINYNLYIRGYGNIFDWQLFEQVIRRDFISVVTNRLCQFGGSAFTE